jgi:integrase
LESDEERSRFLHRFYGQDLATVSPDAAVWTGLSDRNHGAPISGRTLADICKRRLNFSAVHQIHHTFAKELEERGVKPSEIQLRLGHQSLRTTTIYQGRLSSAGESSQRGDGG